MKKININTLLLNTSLILYFIVILIRIYFMNIISSISTIFLLLANILLFFNIIRKRKIKVKSLFFVIICIIFFLPTLYNNAYLLDGYYTVFFEYLFTITFCILLYFSDLNKKNFEIVFNFVALFSILTSIITWISFINPTFYINKIIPLLPLTRQSAVLHDFIANSMRMGLSDHYSRNAFYMVIGILIFIEKYLKNTKKKSYLLAIIFLFISLFLVGKRAHLLFLLASLIVAYFIYNKISLKNIIRFIIILIIFALFVLLSINIIPGTENIIDRFTNFSNGDITTGRIELYERVWNLFSSNNYKGIGWGQFARSTNYEYAGVHNDFIQLICETGIVGFMMIVISNIVIFFKAIKLCRIKKDGLTFIILTYNIFFIMYSMTGIPHYDVEVYMTYFILNSILFYYIERKRANEREKS